MFSRMRCCCRDEIRLNNFLRGDGRLKHFSKVLMGDKTSDIRARLPPEKLTSEQQVACLFNQATDPNILGRLWVGCEPLMQGCGGFEAVGGL